MVIATFQAVEQVRAEDVDLRSRSSNRFLAVCASGLLLVLMAAVVVAWSPRYWPVTLLHCGLFGLGIAWLTMQVARPDAVRWSGLFLPMAVVGLWGAVQLVSGASVYPYQTSRALLYWSANAVAMFLAGQFLQSNRIRNDFLSGLTCFTGLIAVVGILQYFTSPYTIYWTFPVAQHVKAVGPFVYRNQFAALVELILPLALYRVMEECRHRWVFAILSAVLVAVVVATASRAGTVLVVTEMTVIFILGWRRRLLSGRSLALVLGQVLAMALVLTLVVGFQDVWSRFQQTNPYALRGKLTESTLHMIRARPVMGFGLGTWQTVYPEFASFDNSLFANEAHNDWAQWTAEGGILFGLALALVAGGAAVRGWQTIWGLGVVFVFLHSFIDYPMREPVVGVILFVLIGAMMATDVHHNARKGAQKGRRRKVEIDEAVAEQD